MRMTKVKEMGHGAQLSKNCVELALYLLRFFLTKYKSSL